MDKDSDNTTQKQDEASTSNKFNLDANTEMNKLFEEYKNRPSVLEPKEDAKVEESSFLKNTVSIEENEAEKISEQPAVSALFQSKCTIYRFFSAWENLGEGIIYVIDEKFKRLLFVRAGISIPAFNFYANFDLKAVLTAKSVKFFAPDNTDKPTLAAYAVKFEEATLSKEFFDLISQN